MASGTALMCDAGLFKYGWQLNVMLGETHRRPHRLGEISVCASEESRLGAKGANLSSFRPPWVTARLRQLVNFTFDVNGTLFRFIASLLIARGFYQRTRTIHRGCVRKAVKCWTEQSLWWSNVRGQFVPNFRQKCLCVKSSSCFQSVWTPDPAVFRAPGGCLFINKLAPSADFADRMFGY